MEDFVSSAWTSFFMSVLGILIGAVITWFVTWKYYKRAGNELKDESSELRKISELILTKLHMPDIPTEQIRNDKGNTTGLIANISANISGKGGVSANIPDKSSKADSGS
jgi:aspartate/glutamate racemase